jgi:hypothetical protein
MATYQFSFVGMGMNSYCAKYDMPAVNDALVTQNFTSVQILKCKYFEGKIKYSMHCGIDLNY